METRKPSRILDRMLKWYTCPNYDIACLDAAGFSGFPMHKQLGHEIESRRGILDEASEKAFYLDSRLYLEPNKVNVFLEVHLCEVGLCTSKRRDLSKIQTYLTPFLEPQVLTCSAGKITNLRRVTFLVLDEADPPSVFRLTCSTLDSCSLLSHFVHSFFTSYSFFRSFLHLFPLVSIQFLDPDHAPDSTWQIWGRQDVWYGLRATNWNVPSKHQTRQAGHA